MKKLILLACVLILLFSSCDQEHVKDFYVVNAYEESITINYQIFRGDLKYLEIKENDTVLIHSYSYVYGTVGVDDDREIIARMVNLTIDYKNNSIPITQKEWKYEKKGKFHAEYYLIIDTTLLEQND